MYTKDTLPMDVEFIIQDAFALVRPQWKMAANLEDAGAAFAASVKQNYRLQDQEKLMDTEPVDDELSSEEDMDEEDLPVPYVDDEQSSSDEADVGGDTEVCAFF